MFAICNLSIVPVRSEASDKSEMVTQLLFGEVVEILDKQDNWRKIKIVYDDYNGWVDKKQLAEISDVEIQNIKKDTTVLSADLVQLAVWNKNQICPIVFGSSLPLFKDHKFHIGEIEYAFDGNTNEVNKSDKSRIIENAYMYLNSPYLWGGRSPFGIDCSGFTQMVFKHCGIKLNRDAAQQAEQGQTINLLEESLPGDLAFFENSEKKITHVGIIIDAGLIIHASGRVRIDRLDHQGIFNEELKTYTHNLRLIKRVA
jgi:hypothetical protein